MRNATCFAAVAVFALSACDTLQTSTDGAVQSVLTPFLGQANSGAKLGGTGNKLLALVDRSPWRPTGTFTFLSDTGVGKQPRSLGPVSQAQAIRMDVTPFTTFSQNTPQPSLLAYSARTPVSRSRVHSTSSRARRARGRQSSGTRTIEASLPSSCWD